MNIKYANFYDDRIHPYWREVKENLPNIEEDILSNPKPYILRLLKELIEGCFEYKRIQITEAEWYERCPGRTDYRNGYYTRRWTTELGTIEDLRVPRCRKQGLAKQIRKPYEQQQEKIHQMLQRMFIAGVSTRRVEEVVRPLLGRGYSAQSISNITKRLDAQVKAYHRRRLEDKYLYLIFDGVVLKGKDILGARKRTLLCCHGIDKQGHREMVDFMVVDSESERDWMRFLNSLYKRGIRGEFTDLIIIDGSGGLRAVIDMVYPEIDIQRCWVHKLRNVGNYLKKADKDKCISEARGIYLAENRREAAKVFKKWERKWGKQYPKAVECLKKDLSDMLRFLSRPEQHRKLIRTTNIIERTIREIRRRTRPMNGFTNDESIPRIIYAIFDYLNRKWQEKAIKGFKVEETELPPPANEMRKAA